MRQMVAMEKDSRAVLTICVLEVIIVYYHRVQYAHYGSLNVDLHPECFLHQAYGAFRINHEGITVLELVCQPLAAAVCFRKTTSATL